MKATFFCKFESDLAVYIHWIRPSKKALDNNMALFNPKDPESYEIVRDPATDQPMIGETLYIEETKMGDSGIYFCAGQTNSDFTPGFLHLKV